MGLLSTALVAGPSAPTAASNAPASASQLSATPTTTAPTASAPAPASTGSASSVKAAAGAAQAKLESAIHYSHVDLQKLYPPNYANPVQLQNGNVTHPGYSQAPEPAGVADYGFTNTTGTYTPYTISTTSYKGTLTLNSVSPYYLADGVPEGFTSQLNVVLQNVTLFGNSSYTFWTQNVIFYDAYSSQFFVENNIWNFSAPSAPQPVNTFLYIPGYTNGTDTPSIGYYAAGTPTYSGLETPFSVVFYINATTHSYQGTNYTEVDFNFQLLNATGAQLMQDQYDRALFNNTGGGTGPIPQAHFLVTATQITPTGFIPYDAEIMLGGPGGGSTATFNAINGSMTLQHWNSTVGAYVNEPATWSAGSETGETCVGVAEYYTSNDTVMLGGGPEFVQPFWNSTSTTLPGAATISGTISPSNSWAFLTNGPAYNASDSAWAPIPVSGQYSWNLTNSVYSIRLMESDYKPVLANDYVVSPTTPGAFSIAMTLDTALGVYTPLYAWANSQLPAISSGGCGNLTCPYTLYNNEYGYLATEFGSQNDYAFPSYAGISLIGTSAYVEISNPAPFSVRYTGISARISNFVGVPTTNELSIWTFGVSNVSILGGQVTGWFSDYQTGFPYANLLLWNSSSILVSGVTFNVVSDAIFTYGGTNNTFVGNTFNNEVLSGAFMTPYGYVYLPAYGGIYGFTLATIAINENEGGDSIWNNYFATTMTAFETNANVFDDLYPSVPHAFNNNWNLSSPISNTTVVTVNGFPLSGSVTDNATVCGNWWWNYEAGSVLPYRNPYPNTGIPYYSGIGNILTGGDYCPMGPAIFPVSVSQSGLGSTAAWGFDIVPAPTVTLPYGGSYLVSSASVTVGLPAGQYEIVFQSVANYVATPAVDYFQVLSDGSLANAGGAIPGESVTYVPMTGVALFSAAGLPVGTTWSVTVNGTVLSGTSSLMATLPFGTYSYTVGSVAGYSASPSTGSVVVAPGAIASVAVGFTAMAPSAGTLTGTVTPTTATVLVDGSTVALSSGSFSMSLAPGVHSIVAMSSGYYSYYNNVTVTSASTTTVSIALNPVTPAPGPDGTISLAVSTSGASATIDGTAVALSGGAFSGSFAPGTHSIVVSATGYYTYYNNVTVTSGQTSSVSVSLNPVTPAPGPDGTISLSVATSNATVTIDGSAVSLSGGTFSGHFAPGVHSIVVSASGYYTYYNNVTVTSSQTTSVSVSLNAVPSSSTTSGTTNTGISTNAWIIIGVLAALAVVLLATTIVFLQRSRRPVQMRPEEPGPPQ